MKSVPLLCAALLLPLTATAQTPAKNRKQAAKPEAAAPAAEATPAPAPAARAVAPLVNCNDLVLAAIKRMPSAGGYAANSAATTNLVQAAAVKRDPKGGLILNPAVAQPSYCSGATYLIFLEVVSDLVKAKKLTLSDEVVAMLAVKRQLDGAGLWGRWNANGPGTARLFQEAGIGSNHMGLSQAKPGDFLKLWWNEHIGKKERGHSVIFLGYENTPEGEPGIRFWSSNEPDGYGAKVIPLTKVKRALISRLDRPGHIAALANLPPKDRFLADMLEKEFTEAEMLKNLGLPATADAGAPPAPGENTPPAVAAPEKLVVRINGEPADPVATPAPVVPGPGATPPADGTAPAVVPAPFASGTAYASYSERSRLGIIQMLQFRLRYDGFFPGTPDGQSGPVTIAALKAWQIAASLEPTGVLDEGTLLKMGLNGLSEIRAAIPAARKDAKGGASSTARSSSSKVPLRGQ